jgi:hypothetical protein
VRFIIVVIKFNVTIAINFLGLTLCMNASYVVGHERTSEQYFVSVNYVYPVNIDVILLWMCKV